jgi:hypothetical protein
VNDKKRFIHGSEIRQPRNSEGLLVIIGCGGCDEQEEAANGTISRIMGGSNLLRLSSSILQYCLPSSVLLPFFSAASLLQCCFPSSVLLLYPHEVRGRK